MIILVESIYYILRGNLKGGGVVSLVVSQQIPVFVFRKGFLCTFHPKLNTFYLLPLMLVQDVLQEVTVGAVVP